MAKLISIQKEQLLLLLRSHCNSAIKMDVWDVLFIPELILLKNDHFLSFFSFAMSLFPFENSSFQISCLEISNTFLILIPSPQVYESIRRENIDFFMISSIFDFYTVRHFDSHHPFLTNESTFVRVSGWGGVRPPTGLVLGRILVRFTFPPGLGGGTKISILVSEEVNLFSEVKIDVLIPIFLRKTFGSHSLSHFGKLFIISYVQNDFFWGIDPLIPMGL